MQQNEARSFH